MAAELLQALAALKNTNDQNTLVQAINQDRRTLDQQTGLINELSASVTQQATELQSLRGQAGANAQIQNMSFGSTVVVLFVLGVLAIVWIDRLQRRIKKLEAIIRPREPLN